MQAAAVAGAQNQMVLQNKTKLFHVVGINTGFKAHFKSDFTLSPIGSSAVTAADVKYVQD